jgi:formylglycine-generating enzyme required for sulfatase activity
MVRIEPGTFLMGSAEGEGYADERPRHEVRIARPFGMGRYPVTFEEYDAFAKATKRDLPGDQGWGRGRRPVIIVSWGNAVAYAQWLSEQTGRRYRLPSEAEWEYAARAGSQTRWSFGNEEGELGKYAWYSENSGRQTHPVGKKEPNPWGLYDVHGNVWEWVQDCWHESCQGAPNDGNAWLEAGGGNCGRRVVRGGSWYDDPGTLRSATRTRLETVARISDLGFRLAQDPLP